DPSGRVLVAGGHDPTAAIATAEIFAFVANGGGCAQDAECSSGHCVDAVCCDMPCTAPCTACSSAKKGGGSEGVCGPAAASTDPHGDCTDEGPASCGTTGMCDGTGSCALYSAGTPCATASCSAGALASSLCNGSGACVEASIPCAPYLCGSPTSC